MDLLRTMNLIVSISISTFPNVEEHFSFSSRGFGRYKYVASLDIAILFQQPESDEDVGNDTKQVVRKGILWHQRDKLFSRWKERFFILTKDYFHCFKKDCSKLSEMGEFLFKV